MKKILYSILGTCLFFISGCIFPGDETIIIDGGDATSKSNLTKRVALICSLTKVDPKAYSGWDGDCPGTDVDANVFADFCKKNGIPYIKLENKECTAKNITDNWKKCISSLDPDDGLFIFFYSGHGGQQYSTDPSEEDHMDETLCFWDGEFIDDKVWALINLQPKTTRMFMVTDCCNSQSNYRLPFNLGKSKRKPRGKEPNMIHFGGCEDGESSYGSERGGEFTRALKAVYSTDLTYKQWFEKAKARVPKNMQVPTYAETGKSFNNVKIFK